MGSSGAQDSPTTALLDSAEMSALIRTARANQSIASELTGLSYDYDVTPADAAAIETTACNSGIDPAIEAIRAEIPGADLSALPALNRLVTETALQCGLGDPAWVDSFSGAVFRLLMSNTTALPTSTGPEPTPLMQNVYTAGCAAIKAGVVQAIKRAFSHRGPAYGLSLAVGSALTECPEYLDGYFGDELRDIIAG